MNDTEHLFICVLVICISSSNNCLFLTFAHFPQDHLSFLYYQFFICTHIPELSAIHQQIFPPGVLLAFQLGFMILTSLLLLLSLKMECGNRHNHKPLRRRQSFPLLSSNWLDCTLMEALSSLLRLLVPIYVDCLECALESESLNQFFLCLPQGPAQSLIYLKY